MKLQFTHDYLGRETTMKQYRKGDVGDFSIAQALELIRMEVAEEVQEAEPVYLQTPKRKRQKDSDE